MTLAPAPAPVGSEDIILSARDVSKDYGGVHALRNVDFDVRRGSVTVLFGENGAGKSTLMKILSGVEMPSTGSIRLDGEPVTFQSAKDASSRGVAIIHQELNLAPNLSVSDNIFMGREMLSFAGIGVDYEEQRRRTVALMERLEEKINPDTLVERLRLGQQQLVEIAKALAGDARVLIMDEPTSALSSAEVQVLFKVIRELKRDGVGIVYISHHLEEAIEIADYAVVLRDGRLVATEDAEKVDLPWVVRQMVGRSSEVAAVDLGDAFGDVALTVSDLTVADAAQPDRNAVTQLNLRVREGEVVCLYGLMGAGRTELLETIAGRLSPIEGNVVLYDRDISRLSIAQRIRAGVALVPEDRQRDGLVQSMSVAANLSLAALGEFVRGPFVSSAKESNAVTNQISDVRLKTPRPSAPIGALSGGNQQKTVIGKILMTRPRVLLLDEPSRGIDVGAKTEIFALMARAARKGLAVLYATSEVSEALQVAHRVVVMSRGSIVGEFDPSSISREDLMAASGESDASATSEGSTPKGENK